MNASSYKIYAKDLKNFFKFIRKISIKSLFALIIGNFGDITKVKIKFTTPSFNSHYNRYLKNEVIKYEKERLRALSNSRFYLFLFVILFILFAYIQSYIIPYQNFSDTILEIVGLIMILTLVLCGTAVVAPISIYKSSIKKDIFPKIISFFGKGFSYHKRVPNLKKHLKNAKILPSYHQEKSLNYILGKYNNVDIEIIECSLVQIFQDKNNRTSEETIFKGIIIIFSMNKSFNGNTIIKSDKGMLSNFISKILISTDMKNVKLESSEFEKKFEVYSTDQIEARYLINLSFMERLLEVAKIFDEKGMQCSFYNNKFLIMVPLDKEMFSTGSIFKPATFMEEINIILKGMDIIFKVIDSLKLDKQTKI